jgi:DNA-binding protein H-NS
MSNYTLPLESMKVSDLQALQASVMEELRKKRTNQLTEVRKETEEFLQQKGFSLKDLFPQARRQRRSPRQSDIRVVNPHNPEQTWAMRGRKPRWATPDIIERAKQQHSGGARA